LNEDEDQRALRDAWLKSQGWVPPNQRPAIVPDNAAEVLPLIAQAWIGVVLFALPLVGATVWACLARLRGHFSGVGTIGLALLGTSALFAMLAIVLSGRPLKRATRFGADFMVGRVYMPGFMGLIPIFAPYALVEAMIRLFSKDVGGYVTGPTTVGGVGGVGGQGGAGGIQLGGGQHLPKIALVRGEGRPLGVTFLLLGTLWPAACALALLGT
jgi:hypothetical protein